MLAIFVQGRFMKRLAIVALLAFELMISGCGSTTKTVTQTAASGTWQAAITGGVGEASALNFITSYTVNGDNSLSIATLQFLTTGAGSCFESGATASGTATLTTDSANLTTGPVTFIVQSGTPAGNTLTLSGTESNTTITGTWTLTGGTGCTGQGDFTMTHSS
jgi:hypothetical protein